MDGIVSQLRYSRLRPQALTLPTLLAGFVLLAAAVLFAAGVDSMSSTAVLAIPGLAITTVVCRRRPAAAMVVALFVSGTFGSMLAFAHVHTAALADVLLLGLWLAAIWGWCFGAARYRARLWPGVAVLALYTLYSAGQIFTADTLTLGVQSFRSSIWYLAAALLIAYAPWPAGTRDRLVKGALVVASFVGAYATFRWAVGPAGSERALAAAIPNNVLDGKLRPVGSFTTAKELAEWTAIMLPFCAALALTMRGRWRLVAVAATGTLGLGMLAADVRAGPGAAVPATVLVIVLYQVAQALRGRRGIVTIGALVCTVLLSVGGFALTLGGHSTRRYEAILHPKTDASYQARLYKWSTAWNDITRHPLGQGLGTAGREQERYGRFFTIGKLNVDNSYLKVALDQGFTVMVIYGFGLLLLLGGLARRALVGLDPDRVGLAIGACGSMVSMLVLFFIGTYIEGVPVLAGWTAVGLGLSQFTSTAPGPGVV